MSSPFVLDCDTGIDDALAILYLLADPAADLRAITSVYGNVSAEQAGENTLRLLTHVGRSDVPVSIGAGKPLTMDFDGGAPYVHGANGVGDIDLPEPAAGPTGEWAPDTIVRLAHENPGTLNIIAIAPLTNIALALRAEPRLPELVKSLTVMGGAAMVPGNITPVAEANIGNDPEASAEVFAAAWNLTMVPLDVTMKHTMEEEHRQVLLASDSIAQNTIGQMLGFYFDFYTNIFGRPCSALHDPMAVAIATGSVVPSVSPRVRVLVDDTSGPGRGQTIADLRNRHMNYSLVTEGNCRVVLELAQPFIPQLMKRLMAY